MTRFQLFMFCGVLIAFVGLGVSCSDDVVRPTDTGDGPDHPPQPEKPATPADFRVDTLGDTFIRLAWTDTTGQQPGILVEGRLRSESSSTLLATLAPGTDTWEAIAVPESAYVFRIAATADDQRSAWTEPLEVTAYRLGYWEVIGGIHSSPSSQSVFFRFGRANRFHPPGTLTITGPAGWNGDQPFERYWETCYIGLASSGAVSGAYHLNFTTATRQFTADVTIDADLALPLPEVSLEQLPGRQLHAIWSCPGADRFAICWGPAGEAGCAGVGVCTDTVLVAEEMDDLYWFTIIAYADSLGGGQPAQSDRHFDVQW